MIELYSADDVNINKKILRREIRIRLSSLSAKEKKNQSSLVCESLRSLDCFSRSSSVFSYMAMDSEIDLLNLYLSDGASSAEYYFPAVQDDGIALEFYRMDRARSLESQLKEGRWGIREPYDESLLLRLESGCGSGNLSGNVCFIVPGVAFSRAGNRLGHGKGFYDRYLSRFAAFAERRNIAVVTVGVCFDCQLVDDTFSQSHDVPVDYVVTPSCVYRR